jgi:hypothetical protein
LIGTFCILIFILVQPAFLEFTEQDLAYHMTIEHTLFFVIGIMSVQVAETILKLFNSYKKNDHSTRNSVFSVIVSLWIKMLRKIFTINKYGLIWVIMAVTLLTFWHIPAIFDYAELNPLVHIAQHTSFILVGAMGFLAARSLGESFTLLALFGLNGVMGFAGLMFSLLDKPIYLVYSVSSHNNAGTFMLVWCVLLLLVILPTYLIRRTLFHMQVRYGSTSISQSTTSSQTLQDKVISRYTKI